MSGSRNGFFSSSPNQNQHKNRSQDNNGYSISGNPNVYPSNGGYGVQGGNPSNGYVVTGSPLQNSGIFRHGHCDSPPSPHHGHVHHEHGSSHNRRRHGW